MYDCIDGISPFLFRTVISVSAGMYEVSIIRKLNNIVRFTHIEVCKSYLSSVGYTSQALASYRDLILGHNEDHEDKYKYASFPTYNDNRLNSHLVHLHILLQCSLTVMKVQ